MRESRSSEALTLMVANVTKWRPEVLHYLSEQAIAGALLQEMHQSKAQEEMIEAAARARKWICHQIPGATGPKGGVKEGLGILMKSHLRAKNSFLMPRTGAGSLP